MSGPLPSGRIHGGPDALGIPTWDFSTNSNACGPCPVAVQALLQADAAHYPDPAYHALREQLAAFHGVAPSRIVLAASASEFIGRMTAALTRLAWGATAGDGLVASVPRHAYGDYAHAAHSWGWQVHVDELLEGCSASADAAPALAWACEPGSPRGEVPAGLLPWLARAQDHPHAVAVLDRAYAPLRLAPAALDEAALSPAWHLWSPNKALGLTGVRAAYAIAPPQASQALMNTLAGLAPSWPVGGHGVALLQAWTEPATQQWLAQTLDTLQAWKARQVAGCREAGWVVQSGVANFMLVDAGPHATELLTDLRARGVKVRDCASLGLPGRWRLGVLSPQAQDALFAAWRDLIAPFFRLTDT